MSHRSMKVSSERYSGLCYILCVMERVGVRELRQNLSVYLRRVRRGETLEVTERGQPVATLQPIVDPDDPLSRLEARGSSIIRSGTCSRSCARIEPDLRRLVRARQTGRRRAGERRSTGLTRTRFRS